MTHKGPANPAAREPKVKRHFDWARLFKGRHLGYVSPVAPGDTTKADKQLII